MNMIFTSTLKLLMECMDSNRLKTYGYEPVRHTPGIWRHYSRPISFTVVVDDFGVN